MKVLHIGKYFPPEKGGMESVLSDLVQSQARQGDDVAAIVHTRPGSSGAFEPPGVQIWTVPTLGQLLYAPIGPSFSIALRKAIRHRKPDIVHVHAPNTSAFLAMLDPAVRAIPWVLHWHADVVAPPTRPGMKKAIALYRKAEQKLIAQSSVVVATSAPYLRSSETLRPWGSRCTVVPLGLDPQRLEERTAAPNPWRAGGLRVVSIGRLSHYKGMDVLVEAIHETPGVECCIIGDGEEKASLLEKIDALGCRDRVRLLGELDDGERNAVLDSADVLVLASTVRTEAFGVVLLEALAMGKPVVVSDIPGSGPSWVVRDGITGLLFSPGDRAGLSARLSCLAGDSVLCDRLGASGRDDFLERFHIDAVARKLSAVYDRAINAHTALSGGMHS